MGRHKRAQKPKAKLRTFIKPIVKYFPCPFCDAEDSCKVKRHQITYNATISCNLCGANYTVSGTHLTCPIDVYNQWIDACEAVNKPTESKKLKYFIQCAANGHIQYTQIKSILHLLFSWTKESATTIWNPPPSSGIRHHYLESATTICNPPPLSGIRHHYLESTITIWNPQSLSKIRHHCLESVITLWNPPSLFGIRHHYLESAIII
ncbi:hypothetical protein GJ496_011228 [Pomphorhynchus laevis]|nr:hypothetical protein GJ496_011228 [Pomphorhynchus laevis]